MEDPKTAPPAPADLMRAQDAPLPTVRDHVERLSLEPWQAKAIVAYLHGSRKLGAPGIDLNSRLSEGDFDRAASAALHGR